MCRLTWTKFAAITAVIVYIIGNVINVADVVKLLVRNQGSQTPPAPSFLILPIIPSYSQLIPTPSHFVGRRIAVADPGVFQRASGTTPSISGKYWI